MTDDATIGTSEQTAVDYEQIRQSWCLDLIKMGVLTDHTQTLSDDDEYDDITFPAFRQLEEAAQKYKINHKDNNIPSWFIRAHKCLDEEATSPRQVQLSIIRALSKK